MSISEAVLQTDRKVPGGDGQAPPVHEAVALLEEAFGVDFHLVDGQSGDPVYLSPGQPAHDWSVWAELCRQVAQRDQPIADRTGRSDTWPACDKRNAMATFPCISLRAAQIGHAVVAVVTRHLVCAACSFGDLRSPLSVT